MEQILYLFNPDFEIQKTDNYIDWTSLSYVELTGTTFSSRTIPVGADTEIDIATLTFSMPIWLSPPVKVSKLGVIQKIIMSIYDDDGGIVKGLIDGTLLTKSYVTPNNFGLLVTGNQLRLLGTTGVNVTSGGDGYYTGANAPTDLDPFETFGPPINWKILLDQYGKVRNDTSQIRLMQPTGKEIIGTIATSTLDDTFLLYNIDQDTIPANTLTAVIKIINPTTFAPPTPANGDRYLIIDQIGDSTATVQSSTWGTLIASVGDIIEYNTAQSKWLKVFDASHPDSTQHYITNTNTGVQYRFNGTEWVKSYEGIYTAGNWSIVLDGGAVGYDASTDATTP